MPVVINDFEIVLDAPPAEAPAPAAPAVEPKSPLRPEDIAEIDRHLRRRATRLRAH